MHTPDTNSWLRSWLILIIILISYSAAFPQELQTAKELDEAIANAQNAKYEQAIPVLKKYAEMKGLDDYKTLEIYIYLNLSYLKTKNDALDVDKVNALTDAYISKYGISKTDSNKSAEELDLIYQASSLNRGIKNGEKMVFYLSFIRRHYEENHLIIDDAYCVALIMLSSGYYDFQDFNSSIEVGLLAWKVNLDLHGEKNNASLTILDILYSSYQSKKEVEKSIEYLRKYVEISKEILGDTDNKYLASLNNLASDYSDIGHYKEAVEIELQVVKLRKEVLGEKHPDYVASLYRLALSYSDNGEYQRALGIIMQVVELSKEVYGEKNPKYLNSLNHLVSVYSDLGDYQKALEIGLKAVKLGKEVLGEKKSSYLLSLLNLASVYSKLGDDQNSLDINLEIVEIDKEVIGEKHPDYFTDLERLASVYSKLGNYKKALEINLKVAEFFKDILGEKHPDYLISLANLAAVYSRLGDYPKALEINQKVIELGKDVWGEKHPDYFAGLGNLALAYSDLGNYQKALEIDIKVTELRKEALGEKHPDYITSLSNLALDYSHLGDYTKALKINLMVVELRKEILGEKHPDYLTSLNNLSLCYSGLGDYLEALKINKEVVELRKVILGEKHPLYMSSISILAGTYRNLGDVKKALEINKEVVEFCKEVLGEKHPAYIRTLINLGLNYSDIGDYQKALEVFIKATELGKEVLGEKHPEYLRSQSNLAFGYSNFGDFQKALEINSGIVDTEKAVFGEKHPDYINTLGNLASNYSHLGNYTKALEICQKVVGIEKVAFGEKHPMYILGLLNLSISEFYLSKTNSSLRHYSQMLNITKERVIEYLSMMTEYQRELFWKKYSRHFTRYPLFFENADTSQIKGASDAYNISLFSKGLLLNSTIDFDKLIAEKGTPETIVKFEELKLLKLQIQRLLEKPVAQRYLNVDSLQDIAQKKETELVKLSKEYGDYTQNLEINWQDVQASLKDKDVAIEFVEYPTLTDTVKYAALVLRKGWQYPKMISLFRKDQIQEFIKQDKDKIYYNGTVGKQIKKLVWDPIESVVVPGDRIYFSAAGIIHQLAIENLAVNDSLTLGDLYDMHRLSSTKELVLHQTEEINTTAVLYGGLQYDIAEDKMVAESKKYKKQENLYAMRGYTTDTTARKEWEYLPGTLIEVKQISNLMADKHYQITEYTGETGNEESFKSLSGKKKGIIHIATHGFFQSEEESRKNIFMLMRMGDQPERGGVDPMLRSGLLLSGGKRALLGEKIPETIEDGVLTAKEISRMDLRGTNLVVLSACETGLGEISSEGVFGLQRSFKQAGVQTLLMSLWEVSDKATSYMMTEFYSNLLSGKDKRASFLEAKRKCKEKFPEPQYWAAFIMLD